MKGYMKYTKFLKNPSQNAVAWPEGQMNWEKSDKDLCVAQKYGKPGPPGEPQGFTFNFWRCGVFHKFFSDTRGFSVFLSSRVGTFHQLISPGVGISQKSCKKSENPRGGPGLPYI